MEHQMFKNACLEDHLERLCGTFLGLEAECMKATWRMEHDACPQPVGLRHGQRRAETEGLENLQSIA